MGKTTDCCLTAAGTDITASAARRERRDIVMRYAEAFRQTARRDDSKEAAQAAGRRNGNLWN